MRKLPKQISYLVVCLALVACSGGGKSKNNRDPFKFDENDISSRSCAFYDEERVDSYITMNDLPCLKKALEKGLDPNGIHHDTFFDKHNPYLLLAIDRSALFFAKAHGNVVSSLALLLSYGGNPNSVYDGTSLVELAMRLDGEYQNVASYLIRFKSKREGQASFDPNKVSRGGTPLEISIDLKNETYVNELLAEGADVEKSSGKATPLIRALSNNFEAAAISLLNRSANVDAVDERRNSALILSMRGNLKSAFDFIFAKTTLIDQSNSWDEFPLLIAVTLQDKHFYDKILTRSQNLNVLNADKMNAVAYLVQQGDLTRTKQLYARGGDITIMNKDGGTVLHLAPSAEMVNFLLDQQKLSIDAEARDKNTALSLAVQRQNFEVVRALAERGANLNFVYARDQDTLLHRSVQNNDIDTTKYLINKGLPLESLNSQLETPLFGVSSLAMAEVLDSAGAIFLRANTQGQHLLAKVFKRYAALPDIGLVKLLIARGVTPDQDVANARSPFLPLQHVMNSYYNTNVADQRAMLELLLSSGANINVSALPEIPSIVHYASNLEWLKFFAARGANLSAPDRQRRTITMKNDLAIIDIERQIQVLEGNPLHEHRMNELKTRLADKMAIRTYLIERGAM